MPKIIIQLTLTYSAINMINANWQLESKTLIFTGTSQEAMRKLDSQRKRLYANKNMLALDSIIHYSNKEITIF